MKYKENKFYVYAYLDIRKRGNFQYENFSFDFEPFYIGKGFGKRDIRHLSDAKNSKQASFKLNKIRSIIKKTGLSPLIVRAQENLTDEQALNLEKHLIKIIGKHPQGPLTNLSDGGEGNSGYKFTDEQRKNRSVNNPFLGKTHSQESIEKMSKAHSENQFGKDNPFYGKHHSPETIAKIKATCRQRSLGSNNAFYGKKHSNKTKSKIREARKKNYLLVSPTGEKHQIRGIIEANTKFGLHIKTLQRFFNAGAIPKPHWKNPCIEKTNTIGWKIFIV